VSTLLNSGHRRFIGDIREAILMLQSDGLVETQVNRGARVTPISIEELEHLARAALTILAHHAPTHDSALLRDAIMMATGERNAINGL
jgi:DNA-binding GntR family transcriptional regulator